MKTLLLLLLLGLAFSIHLKPAHLHEEASSEADEEVEAQWADYHQHCMREFLGKMHAAVAAEGGCGPDMDPEACKIAKDMMENIGIIKGREYCNNVLEAGKEAFQSCADQKCDGKADADCGKNHCSDDVNKAIKQAEKDEEARLDAEEKPDFLKHGLTSVQPSEEELAWWQEKEKTECHDRIVPAFKAGIEKSECPKNDFICPISKHSAIEHIDTNPAEMCEGFKKQAINFYEMCVAIKCHEHRSDECLHETCKGDIDGFYDLAAREIAKGPPGGFATDEALLATLDSSDEAGISSQAHKTAEADVEGVSALNSIEKI